MKGTSEEGSWLVPRSTKLHTTSVTHFSHYNDGTKLRLQPVGKLRPREVKYLSWTP